MVEILRSSVSKNGFKMVVCLCPYCKKEFETRRVNAVGLLQSCGCVRYKIVSEKKTKHNLGYSKIYKVWHSMVSRCYKEKSNAFQLYGGRGIKVCKSWKDDVNAFKEWAINNGYKEGLTIDRIDNNGNYEPSNCRWISLKENSRNRRKSKLDKQKVEEIINLIKNGEKNKDIAKMFGVDASLISKIKGRKIWD